MQLRMLREYDDTIKKIWNREIQKLWGVKVSKKWSPFFHIQPLWPMSFDSAMWADKGRILG